MRRAKIHQVLTMTADWIERPYGWTKGAMRRSNYGLSVANARNAPPHSYCILGGVRAMCSGLVRDTSEVEMFLARRLPHSMGPLRPIDNLIEWNDEPYRTQHQVVAFLRAAAEDARPAGWFRRLFAYHRP